MILLNHTAACCAFIYENGGGHVVPSLAQGLGWVNRRSGMIEAAAVFHNRQGPNIEVCIASTARVMPRSLLDAIGAYAFLDLKVRRLTFMIAADNISSINFVESLGAYREATLQDGCSTGDLYIYCLRPDRCKLWSKLYGRRRQRTSST